MISNSEIERWVGVAIIREVQLMDGTHFVVENPNLITEAVIGLCVYSEDMKQSTLYPWHQVKKIISKEKPNG